MQGRQKMGQGMGQLAQSMGTGEGGLGQQLMRQIESMKQQLGYGGYLSQRQGEGSSGWGLGTSPYAVEPKPAAPEHQVEDRQGDESLKDTQPVDFEPLYAPEDYAHSFTSEDQLHGQFDPTAAPQKVEEVRSAPETQEALVDYADVIGAYAEGEETAISREQVPLEYQQLVREYFEQLAEQSNASSATNDEESAAGDEAETNESDAESASAETADSEDASDG